MKISSEELKDAIETARGGEALLGPTYLHDLLVRQSTNIAADLIRCRELLADAEFLLRKVGINWKEAGSMKDSCLRSADDAKKYLSETEG
jgi:hypothetical protein